MRIHVWKNLVAAVLLAAIWPYFLLWIFDVVGASVLVAEIRGLQALGLQNRAYIHSARVIIDPILWSIGIGVLIGIPFGLVIRQQVFRYWLVFLILVLIEDLTSDLIGGWGGSMFLTGWSLADNWLYATGVLVFALLSSRFWGKSVCAIPHEAK